MCIGYFCHLDNMNHLSSVVVKPPCVWTIVNTHKYGLFYRTSLVITMCFVISLSHPLLSTNLGTWWSWSILLIIFLHASTWDHSSPFISLFFCLYSSSPSLDIVFQSLCYCYVSKGQYLSLSCSCAQFSSFCCCSQNLITLPVFYDREWTQTVFQHCKRDLFGTQSTTKSQDTFLPMARGSAVTIAHCPILTMATS